MLSFFVLSSEPAPLKFSCYCVLTGSCKHSPCQWCVETLSWCIGVSDIHELNYKPTERSMVIKALFLTHTENFDTKDIVKLYVDVADSCVLLLWLTDRDAEKKSDL